MKNVLMILAFYILTSCSQSCYSGPYKNNSQQDSLIITEVENDTCCMNRLVYRMMVIAMCSLRYIVKTGAPLTL